MYTLTRYAPIALSVLRIIVALLFIEHGTQKLFGFPEMSFAGGFGGPPPAGDVAGLPPGGDAAGLPAAPGGGGAGALSTDFLIAGILEVFGGFLVLIGLFTRPVAFILSGEMAVAFWWTHAANGEIFPINNGGDAAALFCFVFLYFVFSGAGTWSIDALVKRWRRPEPAAQPVT